MDICLCSIPLLIINLVIIAVTYESIKKVLKRIEILETLVDQLLDKNFNVISNDNKHNEGINTSIDTYSNTDSDSINTTNQLTQGSEDLSEHDIHKQTEINIQQDSNKTEQNISKLESIENLRSYPLSNTEYKKATKDKISTSKNFEAFFGGRVLNIIGSIILIIGLGLLIKFAFDNHWINEAMIVTSGGILGFAILYIANIFYKKGYPYFTQGLVGTGISILYLSDYASYNLYNLLPGSIAFIFGVCISVIAIFSALKYDSLAVSIIGLVGGFLTPFLLASNNSQIIGLFAYLSLLNIGILALVYKRPDWHILKLITIIATYISFYIVSLASFDQHTNIKIIFTSFINLSYLISAFINKENKALVPVLSGLLYLIAIGCSIQLENNLISIILIINGLIHLSFAELTDKISSPLYKLYNSSILTGVISILISINLYFTGFEGIYTSIICYSLLALLMIYLSKLKNKPVLWKYALGIFCLTLLKIIFNNGSFIYPNTEVFIPFINVRFAAYAAFIGSIFLGSHTLKKISTFQNNAITDLLNFSWILLTFMFINIELIDLYNKCILANNLTSNSIYNYNFGLMLSLFAMIFSMIVIRFGISTESWVYNTIGYPIFFLSILYTLIFGTTTYPLEYFTPIINLKFLTVISSVICINVINLWHKRKNGLDNNFIQIITSFTTCIAIFILITSEVNDYFESISQINKANGILMDALQYNKFLVFDLVWSLYSLIILYFGIIKRKQLFYTVGLITLLLSLCVAFLISFFFIPLNSFVLIFNLRFIVIASVIICLIALHKIVTNTPDNWKQFILHKSFLKFLICAFVLVIITSETSTFYELQSNGSRVDYFLSIINSQKQFVLSALWMIYSIILMFWGIYNRSKVVRITSISLFSLTICKLFLVDLAFLDSFLRVISFIIFGLILIFASYLYQKYKDIIMEPEN